VLGAVDHIQYFHWNKVLAQDENTERSLIDLDCVEEGIEHVEEP
jgi:hypothetical protein